MGINTGYCNVGNFGSDQRLTYTIIGGEVNIAQRLDQTRRNIDDMKHMHTQKDLIEVEQLELFR